MRKFTRLLLFLCFLPLAAPAQDLDIMFQGWYWDYFQNGNYGTWINNLNSKAIELDDAGFKHIWLPPLSRSSTSNNISNGYNPMDLYDLGEFGPGCAWGTRAQLNTLISNYNGRGLNVVSDMIYNHRDGGKPERNDAVRYFITNTSNNSVYPSDRVFMVLPLGSANPGNNGAGDYYVKVRSKSYGYGPNQYKFYAKTRNTPYAGATNETEPNGGADCNPDQPTQVYTLGTDMTATLYDYSGCYTDEYKITLTAGNFNATDDTLFIYMNNVNSGYSDHFIYDIYSNPASASITSQLEYWTYTDYSTVLSGQGSMNYNSFRPNDNTSNAGGISETLGCDWNCPLFFYDYDQAQQSTKDVLNAWTKWELQQGIKGLRMDAVKNFDPAYVGQLMTYLYDQGTTPEFVVGEYFDYSPSALKGWVDAVYGNMSAGASAAIKVRAFDFALRGSLKSACDGGDVRNVFEGGMVDGAGANSANVVTFIDNHDLRKDGLAIQQDAALAHAYILTNNQIGAPCVFYPDYYGGVVSGAPNIMLKNRINALNALHKLYIYNSPDVEYLSRYNTPYPQFYVANGNNSGPEKTLIYQLAPNGSGKNVIVAINFSDNPMDMYQRISTAWGATGGTLFTDVLGYSSTPTTTITSPNNEIHVLLPAHSYTVYVEGINAPLAVELLDFQATAESASILLDWKTTTEKDFSRYEIERSAGDANHFETIGTVAGKNAENGAAYQLRDIKPVFNTPLYYRLRMVDTDGQASYSPVRQAQIQRRALQAFLAPNPTIGDSELLLQTAQTQEVKLVLTNTLGQVVFSRQYTLEAGQQRLPLPTAQLPNGLYYLVIQSVAETQTLPIQKN